MAEPDLRVLLLAGRLREGDETRPIRPLLDRLCARGVSAQVLCASANGPRGGDLRVVECPGLRSRWRRAFSIRGLRLGEELRRPALMHVLDAAMAPLAPALAELWRVPYVQSVDEFADPRRGLRVSRRWCRRLIAAGDDLAADLVQTLGVPGRLVAVANPGFAASGGPAGGAEAGRVPVVGTAGPLANGSGMTTFLGAARRVVDAGIGAEFVIAGGGEDEADLRRRADRLAISDRVTFASAPVLGPRFWGVLDVFCQASTVPASGRPLGQALAAGVPSVASDVEGLRDLVRHERTGLRVPPGESDALGRAILRLLGDPPLARRLGEAGRELILRDFTPDAEADAFVSVYRRAVAEEERPIAVADAG